MERGEREGEREGRRASAEMEVEATEEEAESVKSYWNTVGFTLMKEEGGEGGGKEGVMGVTGKEAVLQG